MNPALRAVVEKRKEDKRRTRIALQMAEDAKDDEMIEYTKETVDKRLRQIVGEKNFADWDQRYYL